MIKIKQKGNFSNLTKYFENIKHGIKISDLEKYGEEGVRALASATPKDSGQTANSWYYEIERQNGRISITFKNSNINKGVNIAIILQYGHATKNGGWVEGQDYINPAMKPIFDKLANEAWKEVTKS